MPSKPPNMKLGHKRCQKYFFSVDLAQAFVSLSALGCQKSTNINKMNLGYTHTRQSNDSYTNAQLMRGDDQAHLCLLNSHRSNLCLILQLCSMEFS